MLTWEHDLHFNDFLLNHANSHVLVVAIHVCPVINMVVNWDDGGEEDGRGSRAVDNGDRYGCSVKVPSCDVMFVMMYMCIHSNAIILMVNWTGVRFLICQLGVHV